METLRALLESRAPALVPLTSFAVGSQSYEQLTLPFIMQAQTQSNWCWAATAVSVAKFYQADSSWTQCQVASQTLNLTNCCEVPTPGACSQPWYLEQALTTTQTFSSLQEGAITWEQLKQELTRNDVLGVRVGWRGGGGHFLVIHGVIRSATMEYLAVGDPIYGAQVVSYTQFASNYQGSGEWTHTYFTHRQEPNPMFTALHQIDPELFRPVLDVRPLTQPPGTNPAGAPQAAAPAGSADPKFELVHFAHILSREALLSDASLELITPPTSVRAIESYNSTSTVLYEVSTDSSKPALLQMTTDPSYLSLLDQSLAKLRTVDLPAPDAEMHLLRIPALNVEALWLRSAQGDEHFYVLPRFANGPFEDKVYSKTEFFDRAKVAARQQVAQAKDSDLLGA